jgi:hypothetical protein
LHDFFPVREEAKQSTRIERMIGISRIGVHGGWSFRKPHGRDEVQALAVSKNQSGLQYS